MSKRMLVGLAVVSSVTFISTPAFAAGSGAGAQPVTTVADGLNSPGGIDFGVRGIYLAEADKGQITRVDEKTGAKSAVVSGLKSPSAVANLGSKLVIVTAGAEVPDTNSTGDASVFTADKQHGLKLLADLKQYELNNNPDGQLQFDPTTHEPLDALSNPFAVIEQRGKHGAVLVADAGANDVLSIDNKGNVSTFFVPPLITTGLCAGAENNDPGHAGCDPVPTGLAYGPNGDLYVSTLSALTPGEGRVYVLNAWTGKVKRVISGLDAPTGVAVDSHGNVYVSEVTYGAPEGDENAPPPPGFDPATVGRIVKIDCRDQRTVAAVTMPLGLKFHNGTLYSGAWAIAGEVGLSDKGQIVKVAPSAFK